MESRCSELLSDGMELSVDQYDSYHGILVILIKPSPVDIALQFSGVPV